MKNLLILCIGLLTLEVSAQPYRIENKEPEYSMAQFIGGMQEMKNFIQANLNYPKEAEKYKIQGKVLVGFRITETGKIDSVKIIKGIGYGCDEEAVRVIKLMPDWIPGRQAGKPISFKFIIPINFKE